MTADQTALERLLETEARLDRMLSQERVEADALIGSAQAEAAELEQGLDAELATLRADVDRRLGIEQDARLAILEDEGKRALARFESLTPDQIRALADWIVDQVLSGNEGDAA